MKRHSLSFKQAMKLMRKHDPELAESGFASLQPYAHQYVDELIAAFREERDHGLRCWLLELIAEAKSPKAYPVLVECLRSDGESLWSYAIFGLKRLDTKEARKLLWEARSFTKSTDEKTQYFQQTLEQPW